MSKSELEKLLKDNLSIGVQFDKYTYGGPNELTVTIKFDGQTIAKDGVCVEPDLSDNRYY